ncbi:hypothetical protein CTAYLR_001955 [Chrysophaeum taylorii]|uniref:RRM domain-containing protein n=1 Tax=Chrysophaeum taylorii TaxID=2483200 RepID=A0AAD7XJ38_9STRA|nr:hypothetical protein CTAYLR_001955 [Chrysophaeum taylorii]
MATSLDLPLEELIKRRQGEGGGPKKGRRAAKARADVATGGTRRRREQVTSVRREKRSQATRARRDVSILDRLGPKVDSLVGVSNLPFDVLESDLEELFGQVGQVSRVDVDYDDSGRSLGTATVTMATAKLAKAAVQQYDKITIDGAVVSVSLQDGSQRPSQPSKEKANVRAGLFGTALKGISKGNGRPKRRNRPNSAAIMDLDDV